jgi:hypothetical protein
VCHSIQTIQISHQPHQNIKADGSLIFEHSASDQSISDRVHFALAAAEPANTRQGELPASSAPSTSFGN